MGKNQQYASEYAEAAMEQMKKYGIPASVILAQGILESSNGESELSRLGNNHFGVKATASWLEQGGQYLVYTDDKPNEKFCSYPTVADSYEHHSRFLVENQRYANLFSLSPDDYRSWTHGLWDAGYANKRTDANGQTYEDKLNRVIEANHLDRYDKQVMAEMQGRAFGRQGESRGQSPMEKVTETTNVQQPKQVTHYAFPIDSNEFLLVTSPFGSRRDPIDSSKTQMHKGIDIRCDHAPLLATEDGGRVCSVNNDAQRAGGRSIGIEYTRGDGTKTQVTYMHLDSINVKPRDTVHAGQEIGISGNSGSRTTGPHLHLEVSQITADGGKRAVDPAAYLADIAQKGEIKQGLMYNGENLLCKYTTETQRQELYDQHPELAQPMGPETWMHKLLSSEDAGGQSLGDPIMNMIFTLFSSLMALAYQIDNRSQGEKMQAVTDAALGRKIDLTGLIPGVKECVLVMNQDSKAQLEIKDDHTSSIHVLSEEETRMLSSMLHDPDRSNAEKQQRMVSFVNQIVIQQQLSENYNQQIGQGESQSLQR